jgi:hypothetical protein
MTVVYEFPKKAYYGKVMPKNKIYAYANPRTRITELFVREVDKITWEYKLSPQTLNVPASGYVKEIQVIVIDLKSPGLNYDVLKTIDKVIPSPILFVIRANNKFRYAAAYKRQNEADRSKWVISEYFSSDWIKQTHDKQPLPLALNLKVLYEMLIKNLIPLKPAPKETMEKFITRIEKIGIKKREAKKLEKRIRREKQFNRKVELNKMLTELKQEIGGLQNGK